MPDVAAITDVHGTFTLSAPVTGEYTLGVHADGYARASVPCVACSASGQPIRIALSR